MNFSKNAPPRSSSAADVALDVTKATAHDVGGGGGGGRVATTEHSASVTLGGDLGVIPEQLPATEGKQACIEGSNHAGPISTGELLVLVCTANMGNAAPTEESVAAWLPERGICREVLETEGHAMDDGTGGVGTEEVRGRVLGGTDGMGGRDEAGASGVGIASAAETAEAVASSVRSAADAVAKEATSSSEEEGDDDDSARGDDEKKNDDAAPKKDATSPDSKRSGDEKFYDAVANEDISSKEDGEDSAQRGNEKKDDDNDHDDDSGSDTHDEDETIRDCPDCASNRERTERRFDVIVIGMQEATFNPKKGESSFRDGKKKKRRRKSDDSLEDITEEGVSITTAASSVPSEVSAAERHVSSLGFESDSSDDEGGRNGNGNKGKGGSERRQQYRRDSSSGSLLDKVDKALEKGVDKIVEGVKDVGEAVKDVGEVVKDVGGAVKDVGEGAAAKVLAPVVMMVGRGGHESKDTEHTDQYEAIVNEALHDAPRKVNPTEWALGTKELRDAIAKRLGGGYRFHVRCQRGEMRLYVLVRRELRGWIKVGDVYGENTGIGQVLANKGGMAVTLTAGNDTRLSFVTAHLEAHEGKEHYDGRCDNLSEILKGARPGLLGGARVGVGPNAGLVISPKPSRGFYDATVLAHHSFVCGDLNFRVSLPEGVPGGPGTLWEGKSKKEHKAKVRQMVEREQWDELNRADELFHALRVGDCLSGFKTPVCRFNPTFKVERKAGFHYKDQRTPSYTDRILWKSVCGLQDHVRPLAYGPIAAFSTSDHKPMRGAFAVKLNDSRERSGGQSTASASTVNKPSPFRSARAQANANASANEERILHLFITDIKCTGLPKRKVTDRTDAYIVFVTDSADIMRLKVSKKDKILRNFGWTRNKTKKDKVAGTEVKHRDGWPRTPVMNDTSDPDWGEYEVHLKIRKPKGGAGSPLEKTERLGPKGAMLYITVMAYDPGPGDQLIGTVALSLPSLCGECNDGFLSDTSRRSSFTKKESQSALPFDVIDIDEPIVRWGKLQGRLQCSITPWDLDSTAGTLLSARKGHKREAGKEKTKLCGCLPC